MSFDPKYPNVDLTSTGKKMDTLSLDDLKALETKLRAASVEMPVIIRLGQKEMAEVREKAKAANFKLEFEGTMPVYMRDFTYYLGGIKIQEVPLESYREFIYEKDLATAEPWRNPLWHMRCEF